MSEGAERVYHVELRQFPHNMCRFNLSGGELRAQLLDPWARERWVEFGERKWSPHQATLTVLEGPRIPFGQLTMGRGWRTAQRSGRDVTQELLAAVLGEVERGGEAAVRTAGEGSPSWPGESSAAGRPASDERAEDLAADSLGLELIAKIGGDAMPLRRAWELAGERNPGARASVTLAHAEKAVESLLRARLVELVSPARTPGGAPAQVSPPAPSESPEATAAAGIAGEEAAGLLRDLASWGVEGAGAVLLRRL